MRKIFVFFAFVISLSAGAQTLQQWKDSISVLTKKIELNPKSLELRMRKAECNIALEQWQYALDEYSNILDLHPTHIGALYFRAFVNQKLHRYSFARADYEQVLKYEPDHKSALTGLILTKIEEQRLQEAYDQANHLVELYKDDAASYATRAQVEEAMEGFALAIDDISLIINRFNEKKFRRMDVYDDLDAVIDEAGARLLGIVPEDSAASSASQKGQPVEGRMKASLAFDRIAARLDGKSVPLQIGT